MRSNGARRQRGKGTPTPTQLLAAVPHIAHDVMLLRMSNEYRGLRVGWTSWYVMARNVAIFLQVPKAGGRHDDIKCGQFFGRGDAMRRWEEHIAGRLREAPAALQKLHGDACQAAAHLSWRRIDVPDVQAPSTEVTRFLMELWAEFVTAVPAPYRRRFLDAWRELHKGRKRNKPE